MPVFSLFLAAMNPALGSPWDKGIWRGATCHAPPSLSSTEGARVALGLGHWGSLSPVPQSQPFSSQVPEAQGDITASWKAGPSDRPGGGVTLHTGYAFLPNYFLYCGYRYIR